MATAVTGMTPLLLDVARAVRLAVLPHLGRPGMRGAAGVAVGGDVTFRIDEVAERAALEVLERCDDLAWYTEDVGLVVRGRPERVLVIDPIDGTRPAGAGLESACVSVASAPWREEAVLGDVDEGLVLEIRSGTLLHAATGKGVRILSRGETRPASPSGATEIAGSFWAYGLRGRPAMASAVVLSELVDTASVSGGTFDLGAAAFAMTRVATGQLDAYVDHGHRMVEEIPETRLLFERLANGAVLCNSPYDVAAALVICREGGCVATDAAGKPLGARPLLGSGPEHQLSTLVACTPELHAALLAGLDRGVDRLRERVLALGIDAL